MPTARRKRKRTSRIGPRVATRRRTASANGFATAAVLDIDEDGGARALRTALEDSVDEFSVIVVEAPVGAHQDAVLARLATWSGRGDVPTLAFVDVSSSPVVLEPLRDAIERAGTGGVVLFGIEPHLPADRRERERDAVSPGLHRLNVRRDSLGAFIRGPLVIVANGPALGRMATTMPDFYSWRVMEISARRVS